MRSIPQREMGAYELRESLDDAMVKAFAEVESVVGSDAVVMVTIAMRRDPGKMNPKAFIECSVGQRTERRSDVMWERGAGGSFTEALQAAGYSKSVANG